mmetsp:Transcript_22337/g.36934  ORF Transcript_22337/g.36934 Transcript_22337/m.36934 type:complete len:130 (-) Transcript_22337:178-567(-)|eukprot:CAMPEP_0184660624 /NCGR_PEP_ID=MMETSP0308-20130426/34452_1 /TAXON_ID=38269 /ORGANISM="Gloeochaete witrockiana, Strain SAG 46.84" /LENGTH=129 /DNA_ID=CAMNT_0027101315 /DNA_START=94 /DNA_END=483 /DNA_ORIENTATION=+
MAPRLPPVTPRRTSAARPFDGDGIKLHMPLAVSWHDSVRPTTSSITSAEEFRDTMRRHQRSSTSPPEKFDDPLLSSHSYGWFTRPPTVSTINHGRVRSQITNFYEEMASSRLVFVCRAQNGGLEMLPHY